MNDPASISIVVSTYERPGHLANCLRSIQNQAINACSCEVIVTDDGSQGPETEACVAAFAQQWPGRTIFLTQPKEGFRLAKCRNRAVVVSTGQQLVFLDADCIVPPHFLQAMTGGLKQGVVLASDCYRLSQAATADIDNRAIDTWEIDPKIEVTERRRLTRKTFRARIYSLLSIPMRPRLTGCAFACHRDDLLKINGFDENYIGWGFEDRDLQRRLAMKGVRARTVLHRVKAVHQWHATDTTFARNGIGTANREYYHRAETSAYCVNGLDQYRCEAIDRITFPARRDWQVIADIAQLQQQTSARPLVDLLLPTLPSDQAYSPVPILVHSL
ncbi:glycosyltransferase [Bremerella sp. JC817]|uniref:glycosyltransferase n=1 Tax=Bremerella sp. JC817 TaxID=3231756 RepID=UPI00345823E9